MCVSDGAAIRPKWGVTIRVAEREKRISHVKIKEAMMHSSAAGVRGCDRMDGNLTFPRSKIKENVPPVDRGGGGSLNIRAVYIPFGKCGPVANRWF